MTQYNSSSKVAGRIHHRQTKRTIKPSSSIVTIIGIVIVIVIVTITIIHTFTHMNIHSPAGAAIDNNISTTSTSTSTSSNILLPLSTSSQPPPPPLHLLQVGPMRTASSLQFELVCLCHLLQLVYHDQMDQARQLKCIFRDNINDVFGTSTSNNSNNGKNAFGTGPMVIKSHMIQQDDYNTNHDNNATTVDKQNLWVFATATDRVHSRQIYNDLTSQQFQVKHVQDLESSTMMKNGKQEVEHSNDGSKNNNNNNNSNDSADVDVDVRGGISGGLEHYIHHYATTIFGLPAEPQTQQIMEFMQYWNILRRCCGAQMSKTWRSQLQEQRQQQQQQQIPFAADLYDLNTHHDCSAYDIDDVEELFMNTTLYQDIHSNFPVAAERLLRPSAVDDEFFGTYCSQYNELVAARKVRFSENARKMIDRTKKKGKNF